MGASLLESDNAALKLSAGLNTTTQESNKLLKVAKDLSSDGFNFNDSAESVMLLKQSLGDAFSTSEIEDMAKEVLSLEKVFGADLNDSIRAVSIMTKNFGIDGQNATDILTSGFQNGLNISGDLLDTFSEYSTQFSDMGFTAEETLSLIATGMQDGAFNTDKLADSLKEGKAKLLEMNDASYSAIEGIGLSSKTVQENIGKGGETAANQMKELAQKILEIKDPVDQNKVAMSIFGTQFEDLGIVGIEALAGLDNSLLTTKGKADELANSVENSFGNQLVGAINEAKQPLAELGNNVLVPLITTVGELAGKFNDWFSGLSEGEKKFLGWSTVALAVIPPVLSIVSSGITVFGGLSKGIGMVSGAMGTMGGASGILGGLMGALSTVAVPLLVGVLGGLAAIIGDNETALGWLQEKFGSLGTVIGGVCEFISGTVQLTFGTMLSWAELAVDGMAAVIDGPGGQTMEQAWSDHWSRLETNTAESMDKILMTTTRDISQQRNNVDTETKGMADAMDTNTQAGVDAMSSNMGNVSNVVLDETGKIPDAVQSNMDTSVQAMKQAASDIYNGCNTSFSKLSTNAVKYFGDMNTQSTEHANTLAQNAKQQASNAYNGCSNSFEKLKNNVVDDWISMKNSIANNPIVGSVTFTKKNIVETIFAPSSSSDAETRIPSISDMMNKTRDTFSRIDLDTSKYRHLVSNSSSQQDSKPVTVQFNEPLVVVQGNIDSDDRVKQLEKMIVGLQDRIVKQIQTQQKRASRLGI